MLHWFKSTLLNACLASAAMAAPPEPLPPLTLPQGPQVMAGQVQAKQTPGGLALNQTTPKAIVNWQTFNIGEQANVQFIQPNAASIVLNRVTDANPSQILGKLSANGQVYLINPQGIYFGKNATVDVGALLASTHQIADADFLDGKLLFDRKGSTASILNEGKIKAANGGFIALVAPQLSNAGQLMVSRGTVAMVSGNTVEFRLEGGMLGMTSTPATVNALVENKQLILAPDGQVILSARAIDTLLGGVVKNSGSIEANGMVGNGGRVYLRASDVIEHSGQINVDAAANGNGGQAVLIADLTNANSRTSVSGQISAQGGALSGDGGFVETSASHLNVNTAKVNVSAPKGKPGTWLLDPQEIIIEQGPPSQTTIGANELDSPTGWTASSGVIIANWCVNSACGYSTSAPYIGSNKTGTGVVEFSYRSGAKVSKVFAIDASASAISLSIAVMPQGAVSGTPFANAGNVSLEFLNSANTLISSHVSATVTQNANTQTLTLSGLSVPAGATQVRVVLQQTTSGNYWAGNYGIAFTDLQLQQTVAGSNTSGIFATLANGGSVTVQTDASQAGSGNIYVNAPLVATGSGNLSLIASNDVILNQPIGMTGSNQTVSIAASNAFVNNVGADAIVTGPAANGNRWLIYASAPSANTFGGLQSGQLPMWGILPGAALPAAAVGNLYVFKMQPTLTLLPSNASKTYGSAFDLQSVSYSLSGFVSATDFGNVFVQENAANSLSGTPSFSSGGAAANAPAGVYTLKLNSSGLTQSTGYALEASTAQFTVNKKDVKLTGLTATSKTYDGTTQTNITGGTLSGTVGGETLLISGSGNFDTPDAGEGKTVTVADLRSLQKTNGTGSWSNYNLLGSDAIKTTANVSPKEVVIMAINAANKTYDGTTIATVTDGVFTGMVGAETLLLAGTGNFNSADVGSTKSVVVPDVSKLQLINGSGRWSNYKLTTTGSLQTTADITPKDVVVTAITAERKTYDGTSLATITDGTVSGTVGTETLGVKGQGQFDSALAGKGKTVTVVDPSSLTKIDGTGRWSNYRLNVLGAVTTKADIDATPVNIIAPSVPATTTTTAANNSANSNTATTSAASTPTASSNLDTAASPAVNSVTNASVATDSSAAVIASNSPASASPSSSTSSTASVNLASTSESSDEQTDKAKKKNSRREPTTPRNVKLGSVQTSERQRLLIASLGHSKKPFASAQARRQFETALQTTAAAQNIAAMAQLPAGGDPLSDSLSQSPSAQNASSLSRGRVKSSIEFEQQLESVNLINTLLLLVLK